MRERRAESGEKNAENKHYRIPRKNVSYAPKFFLKTLHARRTGIGGTRILYYIIIKKSIRPVCRGSVSSASVRPGVGVNDTRGFFAKSIKCINHADIDPIIFGVVVVVVVAPHCTAPRRRYWCAAVHNHRIVVSHATVVETSLYYIFLYNTLV